MEYKCIPAPTELVILNNGNTSSAVRSFADLINREATNGWVFHSMENIAVTQKPGCLAALFGKVAETTYFNMLIFSRGLEDSVSSPASPQGNASFTGMKQCPMCKKEIAVSYSSCPHCGNNFGSIQSSVSPSSVSSIARKIEKKKCSKCKKEVDDRYTKCPNCGNDSFD